MGSFHKLKEALRSREKFLLIAHEQPDGDCLGGTLALGEILRQLGKEVRMVCKSDISPVFSFLDNVNEIKKDFILGDFEVIVLVDNGDFKRTGFYDRLSCLPRDIILVNIDHHPKNDLWKVSKINHVSETVSSTCELIYETFCDSSITITPKIATCLLTGIFTDTGGFQHSNTSTQTLSVVSELLRRGGKLKIISDNIMNSHSFSTLKLWGIALNRLVYNEKLSLVYSVILQKDIEEAGASEDEVLGLINLLSASPESKVALLIYESLDGKVRGSLRTTGEAVNVATLAKLLGGGGHRKASGFCLNGRLERTENGWRVN